MLHGTQHTITQSRTRKDGDEGKGEPEAGAEGAAEQKAAPQGQEGAWDEDERAAGIDEEEGSGPCIRVAAHPGQESALWC